MERRFGHAAEARSAYQHALAIYGALLQANPDNRYFLVSSTVPLMRLGALDAVHGKAYWTRALTILKELDAAGRLEPAHRNSIPWLEDRLGRPGRNGWFGALRRLFGRR